MPTISVNGAQLYYEDQGTGQETVFFAHGLPWSCRIFDKQVARLRSRYRCVALDFRGQGKSEVTKDGYDMETLYEDVTSLIHSLGCAPCHFVGLSMGGFIGIRLAARRPELVKSLTLLDSTADPERPENIRMTKRFLPIARWLGPRVVAGRVMSSMFGRKFLMDYGRAEERREWRRRLIGNDRIGATRATMGVVMRKGVSDELTKISAPTLILVGDQDVALPPEHSERLRNGISGSRLVIVQGAGHLPTIEEPEVVNSALLDFLSEVR